LTKENEVIKVDIQSGFCPGEGKFDIKIDTNTGRTPEISGIHLQAKKARNFQKTTRS
jgi:hypothetical protein